MMRVMSVIIIKDIKTTYLTYASVPVVDANVSDLAHTTIVIVPNGNVLHLAHSPEIVILYKRVVVISRVETDTYITRIDTDRLARRNVKIEFPIGINGERNTHFIKNESVSVTIDGCESVRIGVHVKRKNTDEY